MELRGSLICMEIRVQYSEDAVQALSLASEFLRSRPVLHNLILTLLNSRIDRPEPGRYWTASVEGQVQGVVFQSPLTRPALLSSMNLKIVEALVDAIADHGVSLPGVNGDAATAASFAGRWTERCKTPAVPATGTRLYELKALARARPVTGVLRQAVGSDREIAIRWVREFSIEINEPDGDFEAVTDEWLATGQIWLWENDGPVSMAVCRKPVEGVIRVSGVYTPLERRRHGYAEACVCEVSRRITEAGHRGALYTDLANPTSNSIYLRIGYRAVAECLLYRFG
jgi:predicted GNAT family acetyltransferase